MDIMDAIVKHKGLRNGRDWETGTLIIYDDGLAAIKTENDLFYVFGESVSKYTGLQTFAGIEIYEGDLIAVEDQGDHHMFAVYLDQLDHQWKVQPIGADNLTYCKIEDCLGGDIVGHIFTHEHLLSANRLKTSES